VWISATCHVGIFISNPTFFSHSEVNFRHTIYVTYNIEQQIPPAFRESDLGKLTTVLPDVLNISCCNTLTEITNSYHTVLSYSACMRSVLLYGCETWLVTSEMRRKIQTFVNRCLRYILRIWWPKIISNKDLWRTMGQEDIN
jgi:hypothetical protein